MVSGLKTSVINNMSSVFHQRNLPFVEVDGRGVEEPALEFFSLGLPSLVNDLVRLWALG